MAMFQAQLRSIARNACSLTNGQATVSWYDDDLLRFRLRIRPNYGIYQGSWYEFTVRASDNYPISSPIVISCTYILHPNINEYGEVLNRALSPWQRGYDLKHVMITLVNMFHHPDLGSISNRELEDLSEVEFIRKVSAWSRGHISGGSRGHISGGSRGSRGSRGPVSRGSTNRQYNPSESNTNLLLSTYELYQDCPASPPAHNDLHCQCQNNFVFVTNSKRPLSGNRRRDRVFSQQQSGYYQNQIHSASTSMIDLSDIHESIRDVEPDYEIRSISSDDEPDMDYTPPPSRAAPARTPQTIARCAQGCSFSRVSEELPISERDANRNLYNKPLMDKDLGMEFLL